MNRRRMIAAIVFGFAGFIAAGAVVSFFALSSGAVGALFYLGIPAIAAAVSGCLVGTAILDPEHPGGAWGAAGRGILAAVISYAFFWPAFAVIGFIGQGAIVPSDIARTVLAFIAVAFIGTFWTLPFSLIIGALAGVALYGIGKFRSGKG